MKNLKFGLFAMVLTMMALSFTSCGDESEDPKPIKKEEPKENPKEDPKEEPTKTTLELVKEGLLGTTWKLVKSEVTDGVEPVQTFTAEESCTTGKYVKSIENIGFKFSSAQKLNTYNYCVTGNDFELNYTITETATNTYSLKVKSSLDHLIIDAVVLKDDVLDSNGKVKSEIKVVFKEIADPANWKYSPTLYFKKQ